MIELDAGLLSRTLHGEIVHPLRAHRRADDRLRVSRLPADPVCSAADMPGIVDLVGWSNAFGLRNAIARERGIAAYRAWVPFERIRPASVPQAAMGRGICLAGRRPPALSAALDPAAWGTLSYVDRHAGARGAAPAVHAVSGSHLARSRAAHRDELIGPTTIALARDEQKKAPAFAAGVLSYASTTEFLAKFFRSFRAGREFWSVQNRSSRCSALLSTPNSSALMPPTCSTVRTCFW